jgi:hypothetical protein
VPFAAAAAAADAARLAAADRVRRTLPFEIHARVQSAARAKLRAALAEARAAKKKLGDVSTADEPPSRAFARPASATTRSSRVSAATAALVAAANANAAANSKAANAARGGDADDETRVRVSSLSFSARRAANALRVALAATTGSVAEDRNDSTERKLDGTNDGTNDGTASDDDDDDVAAVTGLADALVASLFHAPPRRADPLRARNESPEKTKTKESLSAREWDDAADAAASFARLVASRTDATAAWDAFASAFFDPAKHWAPRMAAFPESPHTQRAAEDAAPSFFRRLLDARRALDGKLGTRTRTRSFAIGAIDSLGEEIATRRLAVIVKKEDFDAMGVAVARSTRDMLLTVTSEESVGCVGAAAALRAGAALADVLGSTLAGGASDARRTETERLFKCLLRLCLNAGERRTARRVENAARRCGFSVSVT